jgi:putative zinc finger/helix-turn-helix YgiT family protein
LEGEKEMKCVECGGALKTTRGAHRYTESGLSNVTLMNIEVRHCDACGARQLVIPRIEELHRLIAQTIAKEQTRLSAEQVRFLRKWIGWSTADFALMMGVRPETVSRWEGKGTGYQMPPTAERLLRMMVANEEPTERYPINLFRLQPRLRPKPLKFIKSQEWKEAAS